MNKITIIGLGVVGNSIGMALKRAGSAAAEGGQGQPSVPPVHIAGFDPGREQEAAALRRYGSVDEIAPDLRRAVQGAHLVVVSTPAAAMREVLEAIGPMLDSGTTVTDTLSVKGEVMKWAGELLGPNANFVGGHPLSKTYDLATLPDEALPSADMFDGATYCVIPLPTATNESLNRVIWLAETLRAKPLFIDTLEHDSFVAAVAHLPVLAAAALLRLTAGGRTWQDMSLFAGPQFQSATEPLSADPELLAGGLLQNRQMVLQWLDQYMLALADVRDLAAGEDPAALSAALKQAHTLQTEHAHRDQKEQELRAELHQAIADTHPVRGLMGTYLSDKVLRRREK